MPKLQNIKMAFKIRAGLKKVFGSLPFIKLLLLWSIIKGAIKRIFSKSPVKKRRRIPYTPGVIPNKPKRQLGDRLRRLAERLKQRKNK